MLNFSEWIDIDTMPCDEKCVPNTAVDSIKRSRMEAKVFVEQIRKTFKTDKIKFKVNRNRYDSGDYLDI